MKKNDFILIGILLVIGVFVILLINITKKEGSKVLVTVDGKEYTSFQLNEDTTYTLDLGNGEWNTFVIKNGRVDMTDASCPDKICVNHKDIEFNNETIVCLPNKVVLQIVNGEESETDAVAK